MLRRVVVVVGHSLFTESLARTLADAESVEVAGVVPTPEAALLLLRDHRADVVIVAGSASPAAVGKLLAAHPDLPIIRADPGAREVQIITSRSVEARSAQLLDAIAALPPRR